MFNGVATTRSWFVSRAVRLDTAARTRSWQSFMWYSAPTPNSAHSQLVGLDYWYTEVVNNLQGEAHKLEDKEEQKKPTETVAPTLLSTAKQAPAAQRAEGP